MKMRLNYVSNSSTSSYILVYSDDDKVTLTGPKGSKLVLELRDIIEALEYRARNMSFIKREGYDPDKKYTTEELTDLLVKWVYGEYGYSSVELNQFMKDTAKLALKEKKENVAYISLDWDDKVILSYLNIFNEEGIIKLIKV